MKGVFLSLLLSFVTTSLSSSFYIGAVVEHVPNPQASNFPISTVEAQSIIYQNILTYEQHIQNASSQGAQIIVFNEYGLFGSNFNTRDDIYPFLETIPDPKASNKSIIPCSSPAEFYSTSPTLFTQTYKLYVVVDLGDVQPCNSSSNVNCPSDGRFQYNTLIAFGPDGELVARYHKTHLYQESYYDSSPSDPTYFETNFGVKFGMIVCFDLIFTDPSEWYHQNGITDAVYSTEWVNEFPILSALQLQQAWSRVNGANLLASGTGNGLVSSGSGIYSQGNVMGSFFNPEKGVKRDALLVEKVPIISQIKNGFKVKENVESNGLTNKMEHSLKSIIPYAHFFKATPGLSQEIVGKSNGLTCTFTFSVSKNNTNTEQYAILVYEEHAIVDVLPAPFQYCGIVRCESKLELCSALVKDIEATTVFDSFSVSGNFNTSYTPYPVLMSSNGMLLSPQKLNFNNSGISTNGEFGEILLGSGIINVLSD